MQTVHQSLVEQVVRDRISEITVQLPVAKDLEDMKCALFLMLAGFAFVAVHAKPEPDYLVYRLSRVFEIDLRNAEICVRKTAVTLEDLRTLSDSIANGDKSSVDPKSLRKASCTLTCCAQSQGTMTGNKIELEEIRILIQKWNIPEEWKPRANGILVACNDEVKSITDECDVSLAFLTCVAIKSDKFGH